VVARQFDPYPPLTAFILENVIYVNVFWGLLNWLPIRALDGGHLLESFLEKVIPEKAESVGRVVFIATAAAGVLIAIRLDLLFIAILAGWMLLSEFATGQRAPAAGLPMLDYEAPASDEPSDPAAPGEQGEETPEDAWGDSK
jgi:Zn-dependent protease